MVQQLDRRHFIELCALTGGVTLLTAATGCSSATSTSSESSSSTDPAESPVSASEEQDPNTLIATFLLISDMHLTYDDLDRYDNFVAALAYADQLDPRPDHIIMAGDIVNEGDPAEYDQMYSAIEGSAWSYNTDFTEVCGNHEQFMTSDNSSAELLQTLQARYVERTGVPGLYYDKMVLGQHLIVIGPDAAVDRADQFDFSDEQLTWLDGLLAEDEQNEINSLVICHEPIPGTVMGAMEGDFCYTASLPNPEKLAAIVENHARVLYISGHTHCGPGVNVSAESGTVYVADSSVGYGYPDSHYVSDQKGHYGCVMRMYPHRLEFDYLDFGNAEKFGDTVTVDWAL